MTNPVPILLVEDNEIDVEIVERTFRKASIANPIFKAKDGVEAYDILRGKSSVEMALPCVMLVDINMPRMDGFTFLRILMSRQPVAVIVVSSYAQKENVFKALELGAIDFVAKPSSAPGEKSVPLSRTVLSYVRIVNESGTPRCPKRSQLGTPISSSATRMR